jgi:hypothetical protein
MSIIIEISSTARLKALFQGPAVISIPSLIRTQRSPHALRAYFSSRLTRWIAGTCNGLASTVIV